MTSFNVAFLPSLKFQSSETTYLPLGLYSSNSFKAVTTAVYISSPHSFLRFRSSSSSSFSICWIMHHTIRLNFQPSSYSPREEEGKKNTFAFPSTSITLNGCHAGFFNFSCHKLHWVEACNNGSSGNLSLHALWKGFSSISPILFSPIRVRAPSISPRP